MAQIREIDVGAPQTRFARGWHCIGLESEFLDGKPHAIEAFGTKLVVFADSQNKLHVLDAYCRHMGGDLSQGEIKGDSVACPFHDWRWGGNGKCTDIPYARRVPPIARTRSWITLQENKQLFVWNDPEGNPPPDDVTIPRLPEVFTDEWTDWKWNRILVEGSNCREIVDNVVDMAHFFYVHFGFPKYFKNVFEGHTATQYLQNHCRPDVGSMGTQYGDSVLDSEASYFGPSYMVNWLHNNYSGYKVESILINCHYPVTQDSFVLMYGVAVEKPKGLDDATSDKLATKFTEGVAMGFEQDVAIWKNKTKIENPLLCEEDGPVYQLRRWYDQFYVDVADVDEKATQRFEFEIDTSKAVEAWQREVDANLARQAEEKAAAESAAEHKTGV